MLAVLGCHATGCRWRQRSTHHSPSLPELPRTILDSALSPHYTTCITHLDLHGIAHCPDVRVAGAHALVHLAQRMGSIEQLA